MPNRELFPFDTMFWCCLACVPLSTGLLVEVLVLPWCQYRHHLDKHPDLGTTLHKGKAGAAVTGSGGVHISGFVLTLHWIIGRKIDLSENDIGLFSRFSCTTNAKHPIFDRFQPCSGLNRRCAAFQGLADDRQSELGCNPTFPKTTENKVTGVHQRWPWGC